MSAARPDGFAKEAAILALATILFRLAFLFWLPAQALSLDVHSWERLASMLAEGRNPYTTGLLNWPPLWMQVIDAMAAFARHSGVVFTTVLRGSLIFADAINNVLALVIAVRFLRLEGPRRLLIVGLAANPISLLLTCQHGNFDALPVMAILCFTIAWLRFRESNDPIDWLSACLALGVGVLAKTFPLLLAPLLAFRIRSIPARARILGALLLSLPAAVGMSVIYVLAPADVSRYVIGYRSAAGSFGLTGLLNLAGLSRAIAIDQSVFPLLLVMALAVAFAGVSRTADIEPRKLVLSIGVALAALIALGTGYGPQYIAWPLPFLVLAYPCFDRPWRRDMLVIAAVAVATYAVEYALVPELGSFWLHLAPSPWLWWLSDTISDPRGATIFRLPLFASYLWLIATSTKRIRAAVPSPATN